MAVGCATFGGECAGVVCTLGGAALVSGVAGTLGDGTTVSGVGVTEEKIAASWWMAAICLSSIGAIADVGEGIWSAQHRSMAVRIAALAEESYGMAPQCGK